jgi:hypothetical protein
VGLLAFTLQMKLQVELVNALMHIKGYAAPETKTSLNQARLAALTRSSKVRSSPEARWYQPMRNLR